MGEKESEEKDKKNVLVKLLQVRFVGRKSSRAARLGSQKHFVEREKGGAPNVRAARNKGERGGLRSRRVAPDQGKGAMPAQKAKVI